MHGKDESDESIITEMLKDSQNLYKIKVSSVAFFSNSRFALIAI